MTEFEDIINTVVKRLTTGNPDVATEFLNCSFDDLILYHNTLGRAIRNEFKFWESLPKGSSPSNDPDGVSMEVIEAAWITMKMCNMPIDNTNSM